MKRWLLIAVVVAVVLFAGLSRFDLDADIFGLLPRDAPTVQGLKLYQETFGSSRELMLTVRSPDADLTEQSARSLAEALAGADLTDRALWRDPFRDDPEALAELLAFLWFNQDPEVFADFARRFDDDQMQPTLIDSIDRMTTSLRAEEIGRLSRDPFAITSLPSGIESPISRAMEDPFASPDGLFRVLFVAFPYDDAGYLRCRSWTGEVTSLVDAWRVDNEIGDEVVIKMTGDPAFIAEIGSGLVSDMRLAAFGTLILVAVLFWLVHRSWLPLVWLVILLLFVLVGTVALAGLFVGAINAVSLGFAAILLGLAADYALILYQEFISDPGLSIADLRRSVAPSILWAACTTAGAFFMVGRSSLPGLTQLGNLVATGILLAAIVMLTVFLPPLARFGASRLPRSPKTPATPPSTWIRGAWWVTGGGLALSALILSQQLPAVDYSTEKLGPKEAAAKEALDEMHQGVGGFGEALWLLVSGKDEDDVARRLGRASERLDAAQQEGLIEDSALPSDLWPRPRYQKINRDLVTEILDRREAARVAALETGFTDESFELTDAVFDEWQRFASIRGVVWPDRPASQWAYQKFTARDSKGLMALGRVDQAAGAEVGELRGLIAELDADGSKLLGWPLISDALLGIMKRDIRRVLLPMAVVMLVLLGLAFRRVHEVALSLVTLVFSLLVLSAVMVVLGWSWNLMNVMALPLLFGAAVDYGIHIQLALRRYDGDMRRVRETVGRAILLCGASTAAGFGTLGLASNVGLASLGRICAAGIVIAALASVFLLPVWWRTTSHTMPGRVD